jgi:hypothetical protein
MNPTRSGFSLALLLVLAASNIAIIQGASSASTPAVPEFTAKYVDASYDVPTTHSVDPYTGEDVTHQGYHVKNRTIQVTIKNVPFTAYESGGQKIGYFLNIRVKGSYANDWLNVYNPDNGYLMQSNSSYTTVSFSLDDNYFPFWNNILGGGTVDIQVQALVGSFHRVSNASATDPLSMFPWILDGQTGEWSSTQTVTVPSGDATAEPTATPAATSNSTQSSALSDSTADNLQVNDLVIIVISASATIIVAIIAVAVVLIKRAKTQIAEHTPN